MRNLSKWSPLPEFSPVPVGRQVPGTRVHVYPGSEVPGYTPGYLAAISYVYETMLSQRPNSPRTLLRDTAARTLQLGVLLSVPSTRPSQERSWHPATQVPMYEGTRVPGVPRYKGGPAWYGSTEAVLQPPVLSFVQGMLVVLRARATSTSPQCESRYPGIWTGTSLTDIITYPNSPPAPVWSFLGCLNASHRCTTVTWKISLLSF
eukprot:2511917-Rhodomonas_salina.2